MERRRWEGGCHGLCVMWRSEWLRVQYQQSGLIGEGSMVMKAALTFAYMHRSRISLHSWFNGSGWKYTHMHRSRISSPSPDPNLNHSLKHPYHDVTESYPISFNLLLVADHKDPREGDTEKLHRSTQTSGVESRTLWWRRDHVQATRHLHSRMSCWQSSL